jgi:hypothetical protein
MSPYKTFVLLGSSAFSFSSNASYSLAKSVSGAACVVGSVSGAAASIAMWGCRSSFFTKPQSLRTAQAQARLHLMCLA